MSGVSGFGAIAVALGEGNYRRYVIGNAVSLTGTWVQRVAVGWLAWELTGSGAWLGLIVFADLAPAMLIGPLGGALADRGDRLRLLRIGQSLMMAQALVLFALTVSGLIDRWSLMAVVAVGGGIVGINQPARLALVPSLVSRQSLSTAIAINSVVFNLARFVGPAVAGLLIVSAGTAFAFAVNAVSFLAFLLALRGIRLVTPEATAPRGRGGLPGTIAEGMRYAAGLSICRELCAAQVPAAEITAGVDKLLELLLRFSPYVEPSDTEPGVFWVDASGLIGLETSLQAWVGKIQSALAEACFVGHIVVGFHRFSAYALARSRHPTTVFEDLEQEQTATHAVRFDRLHLDPKLREHLAKLDIHTVGEFLRLPVDGLARRFGAAALQLHQEASAATSVPLDPTIPVEPLEAWIELEYPERDAYRLTFAIQRVLPLLLQRVAARGHGLNALSMTLKLDNRTVVTNEIRTAETTLNVERILELVRLKLESTKLGAGAVEIDLRATSRAIDKGQLDLFTERPRRDLSAAARAMARVRAEFGRLTVVFARLQRAHLPEASFSWEPLEHARIPAPLPVQRRPLIRRIFDKPVPLPQRGRHEPDGWLVRGPEQGPITRISGPYTVSGGWWVREVHRDYHFVETAKGDVMWVYYDRQRRRWFLQGQVE